MAGYSSRQSSYTTGDTITAAHSNDEFDAIITAFGTSGHNHDGTAGNGGGISKLAGSNSITIGAGTAGEDVTVTFDGETNDGVLYWMEDEDYFKFNDKIMIVDDTTLIFGTDSNWTIEYDENGDDDLVLTGSDISVESSTSAKPVFQLLNTNADANGATIKFNKNGASPATDDVIGNIDFLSEDAGNAATTYGRIQGTIVDVTAGGEQGGIDFYVAENDGTLTKGLAIAGAASDTDITVDISTHDGTAGGLKLGGTLVTATATELNYLDGKSAVPVLSGTTDNTIVTVTGAHAMQGEDHLKFDGSDLTLYEDVNDGNPSISIGGAAAERGMIQAVFDSSAQTLNYLEISTATADSGGDAGKIVFDVDGTDIAAIDDGGITFTNSANWEVGVAATSGTTAGKGLTVSAGATATGSANLNGGDLTLSSGGGDGTGTSKIDFKTKVANTDAPASKMQLSGAGVLTLSAGGIVIPDSGTIGSASSTSALTIDSSGNVTCGANLTISGTTTTVNTSTLTVEDPLIALASGNNSADAVDIGIYGLYDTSGSQDLYGGLFRDANDSGKWKLFKDNQAAPTTTVDVSGTGYAVATLVANVEGNVNGDLTGTLQTAAQTNITSVGALDGGSITTGFGTINNGSSTITTSGAITGGSFVVADGANIGSASDTDALAISSGGVVNFTQAPTVASAAIKTAGKETIWIPASAMTVSVNAPSAAVASIDSGSVNTTVPVLDFDPGSSDEVATFNIAFPKAWNAGTITARFFWTNSDANAGNVVWGLQGVCIADSGALDSAMTDTGEVIQDANITTSGDLMVTSSTPAITINGAADDGVCFFNVFRDASDTTNDTYASDARLVGVQVFYTTDAANDA